MAVLVGVPDPAKPILQAGDFFVRVAAAEKNSAIASLLQCNHSSLLVVTPNLITRGGLGNDTFILRHALIEAFNGLFALRLVPVLPLQAALHSIVEGSAHRRRQHACAIEAVGDVVVPPPLSAACLVAGATAFGACGMRDELCD